MLKIATLFGENKSLNKFLTCANPNEPPNRGQVLCVQRVLYVATSGPWTTELHPLEYEWERVQLEPCAALPLLRWMSCALPETRSLLS